MQQPIHTALVSESRSISVREVLRVAAALNKQVRRDFNRIWDVEATVSGFADLEDVPVDSWPMIVMDDIGFDGAAGIHLDENGQPFALIEASAQWSLTASHEVLEMLADPFGNRLVAGPSLMPGQGRVNYLVEVCDPSEAAQFGYRVNGILVSDFYTPSFFDPVKAPGVRYSFTGDITEPRQVLEGGYISWHEPISDKWFQKTFFGSAPEFVDLGRLARAGRSLREMIDEITSKRMGELEVPRGRAAIAAAPGRAMAAAATAGTPDATKAKADSLHKQIKLLTKK